MILAWIVSVAVTIAIVMVKSNDSSGIATEAKRNAMTKIEEQFFGNPAQGELLPYQRLLREARQAWSRGDLKAERELYKRVLDLLHTETRDESSPEKVRSGLEKGITGSRKNDQDLERYILTILEE